MSTSGGRDHIILSRLEDFIVKQLKKVFTMAILSLFVITGCTPDHRDASLHITSREGETVTAITNVDDAVKASDHVVIGEVVDEAKFSSTNTYRYTVAVKTELKGNVNAKSIDVYEAKDALKKGKEYLLFLEYWEHELYPRPVYTPIGEETIIEIDKNQLRGNENIVMNRKKDDMVTYIQNSPEAKRLTKKNVHIVEKASSTEELIDQSDFVLHVMPVEIVHENEYVKTVTADILQAYKGELDQDSAIINLPADVEVGKEYLVFLKGEKDFRLTTRQGSVISKDHESQWNVVLNSINK
jgi:hypothetical protein